MNLRSVLKASDVVTLALFLVGGAFVLFLLGAAGFWAWGRLSGGGWSAASRPAEPARRDTSFTDPRDGRTYRAVTIGNRTWMAENLGYEAELSFCYDYDSANCRKYGRLYDWDAAMDACPAGWRLPDTVDWYDLVVAAGGERSAGRNLKSKAGWGGGGNGRDKFGFAALPGGDGDGSAGGVKFLNGGYNGFWWTASEHAASAAYAHFRGMHYGGNNRVSRGYAGKAAFRFSVRCVSAPEPADAAPAQRFTDPRDGRAYRAVTIGGQTWMAENLNFAADSSACYGDEEANCDRYGRLYGWKSAMEACPSGWRLPDTADWHDLVREIGDYAGTKLASRRGWENNGNGTDKYGFAALPGGRGADDKFFNKGSMGFWWSAAEYDTYNAYCNNIRSDRNGLYISLGDKAANRLSVRCIRAAESGEEPAPAERGELR